MSLTIAAMPAYNEERSIAKMVLSCKKYVDRVVVVDDGSSRRHGGDRPWPWALHGR